MGRTCRRNTVNELSAPEERRLCFLSVRGRARMQSVRATKETGRLLMDAANDELLEHPR